MGAGKGWGGQGGLGRWLSGTKGSRLAGDGVTDSIFLASLRPCLHGYVHSAQFHRKKKTKTGMGVGYFPLPRIWRLAFPIISFLHHRGQTIFFWFFPGERFASVVVYTPCRYPQTSIENVLSKMLMGILAPSSAWCTHWFIFVLPYSVSCLFLLFAVWFFYSIPRSFFLSLFFWWPLWYGVEGVIYRYFFHYLLILLIRRGGCSFLRSRLISQERNFRFNRQGRNDWGGRLSFCAMNFELEQRRGAVFSFACVFAGFVIRRRVRNA